jgi:hypothetical protein
MLAFVAVLFLVPLSLGFADSIPITSDAVRAPMRWKSNAALKPHTGRSVQVALRLRGAAIIYAIVAGLDRDMNPGD